MSSLEVNKVFGAVLTAGITFMVAGVISKQLVNHETPHSPAIALPADAGGHGPAAPSAPAGPEPILALLASADVAAGQQFTQRQCAACHTFNEGGRNGVGPNLYGVVGAPHGHVDGFNYSTAISGMRAKPWTYADLNAWLHKPSQYAPGTRMSYAGIAAPQARANVIAYLRSLAGTSAPLPTDAEIAAEAAAAAPPPAPEPHAAATPAAAPATAEIPAVGPLLAAADPAAGGTVFRRSCAVCHTATEGGRNGVGPNLWNVVGARHGHAEGFNYSTAFRGTGDKPWGYEDLNHWLFRPTTYAPGTRMAFAGLPDVKQRADVIAYLRSLSASPQPLP
ncbi:cytochrome c2 [Humitalea rosea]|uniref:Cytochrome c2 n=1 Tax=Humitalea rosea TaxID=990373 RepID=A0A2W7IJ27_9PROT|nr:cytochrome c family protein [Humitalea rosea]PZW46964.1 cytochrome c2 [Humitalea rosea]